MPLGGHLQLRGPAVRIAYVTETYPPEVNGVALTVARTVAHLRTHGHRVDLIRPCQRGEVKGSWAHQWLTWGCPIPMYPDLRFGWASAASIRRRFEHHRPDLVHVATPGPLGQNAVRVAKSMGLPVTADFRTNFHRYSRYYGLGWGEALIRRLLRSMHNTADLNFVPTDDVRAELSAEGFERLSVVGRGVDANQFSPHWRSQALRDSWGADEKTPVLLYVGRLAAEKQVELALQAWTEVCTLHPQARMVVVGDGPQRKQLQKRWPNARFTGMLHGEELSRTYASADVFLFPSLSETFGNVTLEAMASGLCVVAFDIAAASVLIEPALNGFVVPPGDLRGFCDTAVRVVGCLPDLDAMRMLARGRARLADWNEVLRGQNFQMTALAEQAGALHGHTVCLV